MPPNDKFPARPYVNDVPKPGTAPDIEYVDFDNTPIGAAPNGLPQKGKVTNLGSLSYDSTGKKLSGR